jgi:predicted small secreted protein
MKYQKLIFAAAFCSMAFIGCNSSKEETESTMAEDEQIIEDVNADKKISACNTRRYNL